MRRRSVRWPCRLSAAKDPLVRCCADGRSDGIRSDECVLPPFSDLCSPTRCSCAARCGSRDQRLHRSQSVESDYSASRAIRPRCESGHSCGSERLDARSDRGTAYRQPWWPSRVAFARLPAGPARWRTNRNQITQRIALYQTGARSIGLWLHAWIAEGREHAFVKTASECARAASARAFTRSLAVATNACDRPSARSGRYRTGRLRDPLLDGLHHPVGKQVHLVRRGIDIRRDTHPVELVRDHRRRHDPML